MPRNHHGSGKDLCLSNYLYLSTVSTHHPPTRGSHTGTASCRSLQCDTTPVLCWSLARPPFHTLSLPDCHPAPPFLAAVLTLMSVTTCPMSKSCFDTPCRLDRSDQLQETFTQSHNAHVTSPYPLPQRLTANSCTAPGAGPATGTPHTVQSLGRLHCRCHNCCAAQLASASHLSPTGPRCSHKSRRSTHQPASPPHPTAKQHNNVHRHPQMYKPQRTDMDATTQ